MSFTILNRACKNCSVLAKDVLKKYLCGVDSAKPAPKMGRAEYRDLVLELAERDKDSPSTKLTLNILAWVTLFVAMFLHAFWA